MINERFKWVNEYANMKIAQRKGVELKPTPQSHNVIGGGTQNKPKKRKK